jgi:type II secretory pathway pseudopilin PulG
MRVGKRWSLRRSQQGLGWYFVLLLLATSAVGAMAVGVRWADEASRQREQELLRVGEAYVVALQAYAHASPGGPPQYPVRLEDLLEDRRSGVLQRHLRKLYPDPITGQADWVLQRNAQGGIVALRSASDRPTWQRQALRLACCQLPAAQQYSQWIFASGAPS